MALFSDGPVISTEDLQQRENGILNVASTEGIDLAVKIALAQVEIASQLMLFLRRKLPLQYGAMSPWVGRQMDVGNIVVTDPLRQWHSHKTLALIYCEAYNNQLNDRYQGKWTEYEQLARASLQTYFRMGVGVVHNPIAKALAPILSTTPGIGSSGTFYAAIAWVNEAQQEGSSSEIAELTTIDGQVLVVSAVSPPTNAISWNAYVGISPEAISLQNSVPIGINSNWTLNAALQQGIPPGKGQPPTWFLVDNHVIQRG